MTAGRVVGSEPRRTGRAAGLCLAAFLGVLPSGCADRGGEGPGHRPQALALDRYQELDLGKQAYEEVRKEYKDQLVPEGDASLERVRSVGMRVARAAEIEMLQREINLRVKGYTWDWEFTLVKKNEANAFCLPGGKVVVFSGLLPVAETDDQLATVLGHEIAHALAHHASERIARQQKYGQAMYALHGTALEYIRDPEERRQMVGLLGAGGKFQTLAFDRQQESEADHIGLFLMTFADYKPEEAVTFWERMQRLSTGRHPPEILSDHPSDAHRIERIREWKLRAAAGKQAYDAGRTAKER